MIFYVFSLILLVQQNQGKFLSIAGSSSIIVVRHLRLNTDSDYYRIRCPYHFKHLVVTMLNYSNEHCFDFYSNSVEQVCLNSRSPCRFHAKPMLLTCQPGEYSKQVDVTYHCSLLPLNQNESKLFSNEFEINSSEPLTLHALSFPSSISPFEESLAVFLIGLIVVIILWLTVCLTWFTHCTDEPIVDQCQYVSSRSYRNSERKLRSISNFHYPMGNNRVESLSISVNPFDNKTRSSSKIIQID